MNPDTNGLPTAEAVGQRWSAILRRRYPGAFAAKRAARELGHQVRTVEAWLAGQAPHLHVAVAAAITWRDPLVLFELAGINPPTEVANRSELDGLKSDLEQLGARIARLQAAR